MRDHACNLLLAAMMFAAQGEADSLRRRADWGFRMVAGPQGARVADLREGSNAARAGLREGDQVLDLDGQTLGDSRSIATALRMRRDGDRVTIRVSRDGQARAVAFALAGVPEERLAGCEVRYGSLHTSRGDRVRTVFTRPAGASGRVPTIVFVPWLSCDPVEGVFPGDGWLQLLHALAEHSGWALYRVEKPGVGDSDGSDCARNDLEADLAALRAALDEVQRLEDVDPEHLVIFGGSIGGALAPILAQGRPVAGLIVSGGFSRTWLEHMLEIERRRLTLDGTPPAEINRALRGYADFYSLYLNQGLTPAQVVARRPDLAPLWHDAPDGQYGRPAKYHQQVQSLNVEAAWAAVDVPVLILHGEYDWIMSRVEADHVVELVNTRHPGNAMLAILPRTDHNLGVYASPLDAYQDRGGRFDPQVVSIVEDWLSQRVRARPGTLR
jgi:pimeloyl-ACP methyl ester carboxylesterase